MALYQPCEPNDPKRDPDATPDIATLKEMFAQQHEFLSASPNAREPERFNWRWPTGEEIALSLVMLVMGTAMGLLFVALFGGGGPR